MTIFQNVVSLYESLPARNHKRLKVNRIGQEVVSSGNPRAFLMVPLS